MKSHSKLEGINNMNIAKERILKKCHISKK